MTQISKRGSGDADPAGAATCGPELSHLLSPKLFRALSDPNRLSILLQLCGCCGPQTVSEVAGCCPVDLSVVSRHLAVLRDAGILAAEKRGKEVYYTVRFTALAQTLRALADAIEACCPDGAARPSGSNPCCPDGG